MGGHFLEQFIENDVPWAHLDIAGIPITPKIWDTPQRCIGFGIRLLVPYLENHLH
jgi:leucyl aminopeptidase